MSYSGHIVSTSCRKIPGLREVFLAKLKYALIILGAEIVSPSVGLSQLCTGSLGDPIVHIDFGSGSALRGDPLATGITNYTYSAAVVDDGNYTIARSTAGMNGNWFVTDDHTPDDANGYMMVVNASAIPGDFYRVKVEGLCPGTKYEAAAWVMNLLTGYDGLKPNISFRIERTSGELIGDEYNTGDIPQHSTPFWEQYGFFFTTPAGISEVVLVIRNNGPGGRGNDIALDDITFRPCGPDISVSSAVTGAPVAFCEGEDIHLRLSAEISGEFLNPLMQWQRFDGTAWLDIPGENGPEISVDHLNVTAGTLSYRLAVGEPAVFGSEKCRTNSNSFDIPVSPKPVPGARSNGPVCSGSDLVLTAGGGSTYEWTGPGGFTSSEPSPVIHNAGFSAAGTYYVRVTSASGCTQTDQVTVAVVNPPVADAGSDAEICAGSSIVLRATGGNTYRWMPADGLSDPFIFNPVASPSKTTRYTVQVSDGSCTATDDVLVTVLEPAFARAGEDKVMIEGDFVILDGEVEGAVGFTYYWSPSDYLDGPASLRPKANPPFDMTYTLHAESNNGCSSATDEVTVRVFKDLVIPNTFSPNGDGFNDLWNIEALAAYPLSDVKVYNRYGALVFSQTGYLKAWDGKFNGQDLPAGAYYYIISPKPRPRPETYRGWVTIIR